MARKSMFAKYYWNNGMAVGIVRVMYGYRVQAGYCKESEEPNFLYVNWCCGVEIGNMSLGYTLVKTMIDSNKDLNELPLSSVIKPYHKDPDFMRWIMHKAAAEGCGELEEITEEDVREADRLLQEYSFE